MIIKENQAIFILKLKAAINKKTICIVALISIVSFVSGYYFLKNGNHLGGYYDKAIIGGYYDKAIRNYNFIVNLLGRNLVDTDHLSIHIPYIDYQKIKYQRELALKYGLGYRNHPLNPGYVSGSIQLNGKDVEIPAKFKLKGGIPQHYSNPFEKWSLKIKIKGDNSLFGMKFFSIMDPPSRNQLNEWFFHRLNKELGLISLRYKFIDVTINGQSKGLYAIEENMGNELLASNLRREGPIFGVDMDYVWETKNMSLGITRGYEYTRSEIKFFNEPNNKEDTESFKRAKYLFEGFLNGDLKTSKVFDVKQMATFLSILDLFGSTHAIRARNLKFYFNPITSRIEPIPYDQSQIYSYRLSHTDLTGRLYRHSFENFHLIGESYQVNMDNSDNKINRRYTTLLELLFSDKDFFVEYIRAQKIISNKDFLDNFFINISYDQEIKRLNSYYPRYDFTPEKMILYDNQQKIRDFLKYKNALRAYINKYDKLKNELYLDLENNFHLPLELHSISLDGKIIYEFHSNKILQAMSLSNGIKYNIIKIDMPDTIRWDGILSKNFEIKYSILGNNNLVSVQMDNQPRYQQNYFKGDLITENVIKKDMYKEGKQFIKVDQSKKQIKIKDGKWTINKNIVFPSGYKVYFSSGTIINLVNGANILSFSPLIVKGSFESPVIFESSDSSGGGIAVLQTADKSYFDYAVFSNLSSFSHNDWVLKGAINFYESDIDIKNSKFINNRGGDDWVNIIGSEFHIINTEFVNSKMDALDIDFSNGEIKDTYYFNSGNDAIDLSGSQVEINNVIIDGAGDKGISAGEQSRVMLSNNQLTNTNVGIASKDMSRVYVNNLKLSNIQVGLAAYQKKPEYGSALIYIKEIDMMDVKIPYYIENGSEIVVNEEILQHSGNNPEVENIIYR